MLERLGEQLKIASENHTDTNLPLHSQVPVVIILAFVMTIWMVYGGISYQVHAAEDGNLAVGSEINTQL